MLKVLVPVDGSDNSLHAVQHTVDEYQRHHELEIHLLNVQPSLSRDVARFIARGERDAWHRERSEAALASARDWLISAGVPFESHVAVGDRATEILRVARELDVHHIVLGTARNRSFTRMLQDSTTDRVLEGTQVPVEVVAGSSVSVWERWGLPAGVIGAGGLIILAMD